MAATQNMLTREGSAAMRMVIAGVLASLAICANAQAEAKGKRLLDPLNYKGVTLTRGPLARQFEEVCEYYLHIPKDDLLKPYRQRAGIDAPGAAAISPSRPMAMGADRIDVVVGEPEAVGAEAAAAAAKRFDPFEQSIPDNTEGTHGTFALDVHVDC